jgi:glutathione S-transferase
MVSSLFAGQTSLAGRLFLSFLLDLEQEAPMNLYFSPAACSLAVHIALREAGLPFDLIKVDLKTKKTADGTDYREVNPKGYVPTLRLDDGEILTEAAAILLYVADLRPETGLAPAAGTRERYRLTEWLTFVSSELHKGFGPLFHGAPEVWKVTVRETLAKRFSFIARHLERRSYLLGEAFTVADAYLFTVLRWAKQFDLELSRWPTLARFQDRVGSRTAVRAALAAEGLT